MMNLRFGRLLHILLIIGGLSLFSLPLVAQSYITAGGLRLGSPFGITVQQRIFERTTLEGMLTTNFAHRADVRLLWEQHRRIISKRFNFYYGGGLHKGWFYGKYAEETDPFGLSFIGGLEFTLARINISADLIPAFNVVGGRTAFEFGSAISLRYVLVQQPKVGFFESIFGKKDKDKKRDADKRKRQKK